MNSEKSEDRVNDALDDTGKLGQGTSPSDPRLEATMEGTSTSPSSPAAPTLTPSDAIPPVDAWSTIPSFIPPPSLHGAIPTETMPHHGAPGHSATVGSPSETLNSGAAEGDTPAEGWLGEYKLLRLLGQGAMGAVFLAEKASLGRRVALKIISGGRFSNSIEINRFRAEAEAAGSLEHPGIATVYDVGFADGQHYYSMRYVDGHPLSRVIQDSPSIDFKRSVRWIMQISQAMQFAHEQGVVHRDLKPGNIMIDRSGNPLIVDFGLAKRMSSSTDMTTTGQVMGTPAYMAPEQAMGMSKTVGPAADVYSIGAIFYELLTGRRPFVADSLLEMLNMVRSVPVDPPRSINRKIPLDLQTICVKCLEKDPKRRYQSAGEIAEELQRFVDLRPIHARRISPTQHLIRWCNRNRLLAGFLVTLSLATIVLGWMSLRLAIESSNSLKSFRRQVSTINELMVRVSEEELADVPNAFLVRRNILMKAKDYYEEATSSRSNFPGMNDFKAQVDSHYAGILAEIAQTPEERSEAEKKLKSAEGLLRAQVKEDPRYASLDAIIEAYCSGSKEMDRWRASRLKKDAKVVAIRSDALSRTLRDQLAFLASHKMLGVNERLQLASQIVELRETIYDQDPSDADSGRLLASAFDNLAFIQLDHAANDINSIRSAMASIDRAQEIRTKILLGEVKNSLGIKLGLARGHYTRAIILQDGFDANLDGASEPASDDPNPDEGPLVDISTIVSTNNEGLPGSPWTLTAVIQEYEHAIAIYREILRDNPRNSIATRYLSLSLMQQAEAMRLQDPAPSELRLEKNREAHRRLKELSFKNDMVASYAVDYESAASYLALTLSRDDELKNLSEALRVVVDASVHCETVASQGDSDFILFRSYLAVLDIARPSITELEFAETRKEYIEKANRWLEKHPNLEDEADLDRILQDLK